MGVWYVLICGNALNVWHIRVSLSLEMMRSTPQEYGEFSESTNPEGMRGEALHNLRCEVKCFKRNDVRLIDQQIMKLRDIAPLNLQ